MYPEALIGILAIRNTFNPKHHSELNKHKVELETSLRSEFSSSDRATLKSLPTIQAYNNYYKKFGKTTHVQLQLESIALKGKSIPSIAALVETMFMAELKNQLLTAGHDLDELQQPLQADIAQGGEIYTGITGKPQTLKANDMMISDERDVISSILSGPDQRTRITSSTKQVLFTVYAPPGINKQAVLAHLQDIQSYVQIVTPEAETMHLEIYG
jgi:DNA/RNA-binding domain of Phe-tRNA-synthetase-like protein